MAVGSPVAIASEKPKRHEAECPYVSRRADRSHCAAGLLGRHIIRRPHQGSVLRGSEIRLHVRIGLQEFGDPKIEYLRDRRVVFASVKKNVLGLEVPMNDAEVVRLVQRASNLGQDSENHVRMQWTASSHERLEIHAFEKLHDEEGCAVEFRGDIGIRDADHVLALDLGADPRFAFETRDDFWVASA
jgi:hypothetical protein